jgi:alkylation response protein AidB-like acyl-CoA dehydrogenase
MSVNRPVRPWENEDAQLFRRSVAAFLAAEATPNDMRWREQKMVDREFWLKAGELGILTATIPSEYGGSDGDFTFEAVLQEELGYAGLTSWQVGIHGGITSHYVHTFGTEAQKQHYLPKMATGEKIAALGMTEPGAGSDLAAIRTYAKRDGDVFRVSGQKTFITAGQLADFVLLAVKTDPAEGSKGMTMLLVDLRDEHGNDVNGFRRGRNLDKIGMHGSDTSELFFDDVVVPVDNILGGVEGQGFKQMMAQLPQERLMIAMSAQAMTERAVELTVEYVQERKAFGKPVSDLQNTRFKLAECQTAVTISRAFINDCIVKHARHELNTAEASMAKYWCTEQQSKVIDECVQLFGGYGFMEEYPIARMFADVRIQRIYGGTTEIMKEIIARSLLNT